MKTLLTLVVIYLCITEHSFSQNNSTNLLAPKGINPEVSKIIENNISLFPNNTQFSIAILDDKNTNYIGIIKENDTIKTIDNKNKIFEIGSITKVFTSVLLSHFIHEKKLKLNDSIQSFFDFELEGGKNIQLKQLTNHTSGLPRLPSNIMILLSLNKDNPYKYYTPKLLETYLKEELILINSLGKKYAYSNLGVGLLGYILSSQSNKSYEDLLQGYIFQPLNMNSSSSILDNIEKNALIKGLNKEGQTISNWDFTDALVAAGGIKSSVFDMEKFIRKNIESDSIYNLIQQPTFTTKNNIELGMGWHILEKNNTQIYFHGGATGGYLSSLLIDKINKRSIIVLSNISANHPKSSNIEKLSFKLLKTLGKP